MIQYINRQVQPTMPGGGLHYGASIAWTPTLGTAADQVTVAHVYTMSPTSGIVLNPSGGWMLVRSEQVQMAGSSPGNSAPPYGETFTGGNPDYIKQHTMVAVGSDAEDVEGSFSAATYYQATVARFTGVDLDSPIVGVAGTHRTFVGSTASGYDWWSSFADTISVSGAGAGSVEVFSQAPSYRYYPNMSTAISPGATLATLSANSYTVTQANYGAGSGLACLVVLRAVPEAAPVGGGGGGGGWVVGGKRQSRIPQPKNRVA